MSRKEVRRLDGPGVLAGVSADGGRIVTVARGTARVFEAASGRELSHLTVQDSAGSVTLSGDGRWVATPSGNSARVFEAASGKELSRMIVDGAVKAVLFVDQGRYLMAASLTPSTEELIVTRHPFLPQDMIDDACARLTRNLTPEEWSQYVGAEPYRRTCPNLPEGARD
jgi:hypothetical protein